MGGHGPSTSQPCSGRLRPPPKLCSAPTFSGGWLLGLQETTITVLGGHDVAPLPSVGHASRRCGAVINGAPAPAPQCCQLCAAPPAAPPAWRLCAVSGEQPAAPIESWAQAQPRSKDCEMAQAHKLRRRLLGAVQGPHRSRVDVKNMFFSVFHPFPSAGSTDAHTRKVECYTAGGGQAY